MVGPYRMYFYSHEPNGRRTFMWIETINRQSSGWTRWRWRGTLDSVRRSCGEFIG